MTRTLETPAGQIRLSTVGGVVEADMFNGMTFEHLASYSTLNEALADLERTTR